MERLQKFLARAGVASRRQAEKMILAGRVRVNGAVVTELGTKVEPEQDRVEVDGNPVTLPEALYYYILNKPVGYVTTVKDRYAEKTVMDLVRDIPVRLYPVGRLDRDSKGLLLLTNDGEVAMALTHPRHQVEKTYRVTVQGVPTGETLGRLREGVLLEDGPPAPALVEIVGRKNGQTILEMTIREGRKRQIRRMVASVGHPVVELQRIRMGPLALDGLPEGAYRPLLPAEVAALRSLVANPCG